jgi:exportin-5
MALIHDSHRAKNIAAEVRLQKLQGFIDPVQQLCQSPDLENSISSFPGFCDLLGLNKVQQYLMSHRVHEIQDWAQYALDADGQAIQAELEERLKVRRISNSAAYAKYFSGSSITDNQKLFGMFYRKGRERYSGL